MAVPRRFRSSAWLTPRTLVLLAVLVILAGWVTRCSIVDQPVSDQAVSAIALDVESADSIKAGSPWRLAVTSVDGVDLDLLTADVWGPWGIRRVEVDVDVDDGVLEIPADLTTVSGRLSVLLDAGGAKATVTVDVGAGRAVDGIVPLAGPRSIVADGSHWTMVTAIPVDRFGNPVTDGTPVRLHVRRPDGAIELIDTEAAHLLAGVRVYSGTLAGRSTIRVSVDGATGPEVEVLEVPGPPASIELLPAGQTLRADGRMLVNVSTASLNDRFDNTLLDGTAVSVAMRGPNGAGQLTAVTIEGRAEFVVEAPRLPGKLELVAVVDGVSSAPLELDFVADVVDVPATARRVSDADRSSVLLEIGPVVTELGGFVPDGTAVTVIGSEVETAAEIRDGRAEIVVAAEPGEVLTIAVLGTQLEVVAP